MTIELLVNEFCPKYAEPIHPPTEAPTSYPPFSLVGAKELVLEGDSATMRCRHEHCCCHYAGGMITSIG